MSKRKAIWLTTKDNPFDFYKEFDDWYKFDESKGYCTCGLIARFANCSDDFTESENNDLISIAIAEIKELDPLDFYKIISEN